MASGSGRWTERLLDPASRLLFDARPWAVFLAVLAILVIEQGLWVAPNVGTLLDIARDVFANPLLDRPRAQYQLWSFLGPSLAYALGLNQGVLAFAALHLAVLWLGLAALYAGIGRSRGDFAARAFLIAFASLPLANVLFTWLGFPDVFTFVLSSAAVLAVRRPLVLLPLGFLLGVDHFEQGGLIAAALTLLWWSDPRTGRSVALRAGAALAIGLLAGRGALAWHFAAHDMMVTHTRADWWTPGALGRLFRAALSNPLAFLFSTYNVGWLGILAVAASARRGARFWVWVAANAVFLVVAFLNFDSTRVFTLLSWPLVLWLVLAIAAEPRWRAPARRVLTAVAVLGVLVPRIIVWEGRLHASTSFYTAWLLIDRTVGPHAVDLRDRNVTTLPFRAPRRQR